jgi:archaellum component FlaF (FlaF/FlaG flagellin family)
MIETKFRNYILNLGLFSLGEVIESKRNIEIKISRLKIPSICDFDEINFTLSGDFIVKLSKKNIIFGF